MAYNPLDVASVYIGTFAPRTDVYSTWIVGPDPEHPRGWRPVREPLTPEIVLAGLTGKGSSISAYMIAPGSTSHVLAYDFDTDNGLDQALQLASFMSSSSGLPAYVETSRRGAHLWCILERILPAVAIRMAAKGLLQGAGLPDTDEHIEIRPGSDHVDAEWHDHVMGAVVGSGLGHALRLPLMPHPKTGRQGRMLFASGEPMFSRISDILLAIDLADADKLLAWAEKYKPPPVTSLPSKFNRPHEPFPEETSTASELLRTLWGVQNAAPGRSVRCPAHEDKMPSLSILRDDRRVICKAGHCVLNNNDHGRGTYELRKLAPTTTNG